MKKIKLHDKEFVVSVSAEKIEQAVSQVAEKMSADLAGKNPLFLVVLNGAFMFASDLLKKVNMPCDISFVKLSSYQGTQTSNVVRDLIGLTENVEGRTVVIVEDIIDSGITMEYIMDILVKMGAADVKIATFLFKPKAFQKDYTIDYIGMPIANDFIVGYGLDYDGLGRNYADIYTIVEN